MLQFAQKRRIKSSKGKEGLFSTQTAIAHPEERKAIRVGEKIDAARQGRNTVKKSFCTECEEGSILMKEIGRLREYTFRKVEESSYKRDVDALISTTNISFYGTMKSWKS